MYISVCKVTSYFREKQHKEEKFAFFYKKVLKNLVSSRKSCTFAAHFEKRTAKSGCISAKSKLPALDLH